MRRSTIQFDRKHFTTSIIHIIKETTNNFESRKQEALGASEGRSLNLYYALYRIIKYDKSPNNGGLFVAAVDHALPKIINPNKGKGSEGLLQKKMQCKTDQADSILLLAYGDFGLVVGAFYAFLLFILIIFIHLLLEDFNLKILKSNSPTGVLLVVYLISIAWNVEGGLDGVFASFVHLTIMSIILLLLSKFQIMTYRRTRL